MAARRLARLGAWLTGLILALAFGAAAPAHAQELILQPNEPNRQVAAFVRHFEDPSQRLTLEDVVAADRAGRFRPLPGRSIDFGFTDARIWLKIPVRNRTAEPRPAVLALNVNYMYKLEAWLVAGGRRDRLFGLTEQTSFAGRPTDDLHLAAPFTLAPGEAGAIYISYWSAGATAMPVAIETPESFAARNASANAVHAASYAALGVFIGLSLLLAAIARSRLFVLYAIYIGSVLLFIMHADGAAFRYLWPNLPQWNAFASLPLGTALNITAALFTRAFLGTAQNYPRFDKAFLGVIVVSALTIVVGILFERAARLVVYPLVFASALVFLSGGVAALRDRRPGALYYVIGWATISFAALIALAVNTPFSTNYITFDLVRGSIMVDALMMTLALMTYIARLRSERDEHFRRELTAMRANMDLIDRINALEQRCALAQASAQASGRILSSAFHDMRQPLLSLRLAVQRLTREPAVAQDAARLEASLRHLETLADAVLVESLGIEDAPEESPSKAERETFRAQLVLDALAQMFARDAEEKGLRFRCVASQAALYVEPMVVIRILSNLVANAVKYTNRGGVMVGCRRRGGLSWLCVYDTGPGLATDTFERVMMGPLDCGLAIAERLAAEHGLVLEMRSSPGKGTVFSLGVRTAG
jgi:signal transduction histidine kinase